MPNTYLRGVTYTATKKRMQDDIQIVNATFTKSDGDGRVLTIAFSEVVDTAKNFANDAAAATGGVAVGGIYHTSGALKVRLA